MFLTGFLLFMGKKNYVSVFFILTLRLIRGKRYGLIQNSTGK